MEAHIARIQMDVDYKCPNCYLHFRLSNTKIPQNKPLNHVCPECYEHLTIPPLFKKSKKKKRKVTTKKQTDPIVNSAKLALKQMGFTSTEATSLIDKVYHERISVAELIKGCLKNVEPAKTN